MVDDRALRFDIAIVNYNTAAYLLRLIRSIAAVVPSRHVAAVHVWDNGSSDRSEPVLDALASDCPWLRIHRSAGNIHHGPALDALLRACCSSPWVLLLDSDTEVRRNFVPELPALDHRRDILVGQVSPWAAPLYFYLAHLFINRARYLELPPFVHDGAPGMDLFRAVHDRCLSYHRFRWCDFVTHAGQASLRAVVARGETGHPFFRFAETESRTSPPSDARARHESRLREELDAFLAARQPGDATRASSVILDRSARVTVSARSAPRLRSGQANAHCRDIEWGQGTCTTDPRSPIPVLRLPSAHTLFMTVRHGTDVRLARAASWVRRTVALQAVLGRRILKRAGRIGLTQDWAEIFALYWIVRWYRPRQVLEIGNAHGGSLSLWSRAASRGGLLIHLDDPLWETDDPREPEMRQRLTALVGRRHRFHVLRGDPACEAARLQVAEWLGGRALDFLFLTRGPHDVDVRREYDHYAPLVRAGGLIAVHGIVPGDDARNSGPSDLWREIVSSSGGLEIVRNPPRPGFGIGVVVRTGDAPQHDRRTGARL